MKKLLTIWFDEKGNLIDLIRRWSFQPGHTNKSEDGIDFKDTLEYTELTTYRSARAHFKSINTGRSYSMFLDDFHKVLIGRHMVDNQISGNFRFIKKGQAQAIKLIIEKAP